MLFSFARFFPAILSMRYIFRMGALYRHKEFFRSVFNKFIKSILESKKNKNQDNTSSSFFITPIFYVEWMSKKISCFILFFIFQTDHIRQRRNTIADKERLWPTGVVPYVFEEDLGNIKNKYLTYILFMTSWFVIFGTQYEFWFRYFFFQWLSNVINGIYFSQNPVRMDKKQIPKR